MKSFKEKLVTTIAVLAALTLNAFAGQEGNGGDVVYCNKADGSATVELLDIYEARVLRGHEADIAPGELTAEAKFKVAVARIARYDAERAAFIEKTSAPFFNGTLHFTDQELPDVPDSDHRVVLPENCALRQIVIQKGKDPVSFEVNQALWEQLDALNRAALATHEGLYADAIIREGRTNSRFVRRFNSLLWSSESWHEAVPSFGKYIETLNENEFYIYHQGGLECPTTPSLKANSEETAAQECRLHSGSHLVKMPSFKGEALLWGGQTVQFHQNKPNHPYELELLIEKRPLFANDPFSSLFDSPAHAIMKDGTEIGVRSFVRFDETSRLRVFDTYHEGKNLPSFDKQQRLTIQIIHPTSLIYLNENGGIAEVRGNYATLRAPYKGIALDVSPLYSDGAPSNHPCVEREKRIWTSGKYSDDCGPAWRSKWADKNAPSVRFEPSGAISSNQTIEILGSQELRIGPTFFKLERNAQATIGERGSINEIVFNDVETASIAFKVGKAKIKLLSKPGIKFYDSGNVQSGTLAEDTVIEGQARKAGTRVEFSDR